jgi:hypothetical protein
MGPPTAVPLRTVLVDVQVRGEQDDSPHRDPVYRGPYDAADVSG